VRAATFVDSLCRSLVTTLPISGSGDGEGEAAGAAEPAKAGAALAARERHAVHKTRRTDCKSITIAYLFARWSAFVRNRSCGLVAVS
jgi:hypothetical protein